MGKIAISWFKGNINYINKLKSLDIPYLILSPGDFIPWYEIFGILFIGGEDVHPKFYGEEIREENLSLNLERDEFELDLLDKAIYKGLPVLGICRGHQLINVYFKGKLYQDLIKLKKENVITQIHWSVDGKDSYHKIDIKEKSNLFDLIREKSILVNSSHHQGIKVLGEGLKISAMYFDSGLNIIEAIEKENYPLLGVQWHPERLSDESSNKIFEFLKNFI
ncbi:MAG: gamma-glutamyl-gamma-aminobutyrate hydrolase [Dictyoglomus sp. NZ13-RE01]|nr:MAG: gamma-glutamyl-gamma-aminobutyrate hydrolase [Dictyoglomus sp. NZ13-RE01]